MPNNELITALPQALQGNIRNKLAESWGINPEEFDPNMKISGEPLLFWLTRANEGVVDHRIDREKSCGPFSGEAAYKQSRENAEQFFDHFFSQSGGSDAERFQKFWDEWKELQETTTYKEYLQDHGGWNGGKVGYFTMSQDYAAAAAILLIAAGADPNYVSEHKNASVLGNALDFRNYRLAKALYEHGAEAVSEHCNALLFLPNDLAKEDTTFAECTDFLDCIIENEGAQILFAKASQTKTISGNEYKKSSWLQTQMMGNGKGYLPDITQYLYDKLSTAHVSQSVVPTPQLTDGSTRLTLPGRSSGYIK